MKILVKKILNDKISIIFPFKDFTIEETLEKIKTDGEEYTIVDNLCIDREFYDAYEFDKEYGAKLNLEKAKEVQRNKWRDARKKRFEKLDLQFMLALEKGDTELQKIISNKKQELRDITKTFLPDDLEEIKISWPNSLTAQE